MGDRERVYGILKEKLSDAVLEAFKEDDLDRLVEGGFIALEFFQAADRELFTQCLPSRPALVGMLVKAFAAKGIEATQADPPVKWITLLVPLDEYPYKWTRVCIFNANNEKINNLYGHVNLTPWSPHLSWETLEEQMCRIEYPFKLDKGLEITFPTVYHTSPNSKNSNHNRQSKILHMFWDCSQRWSKVPQLSISCGFFFTGFVIVEAYWKNASNFLKDATMEFGVKLLEDKGYNIVKQYCYLKKGDNFNINVAMFDEACILVECKNNINKEALDQLSSTIKEFASFRDRSVFQIVAEPIGGNAKFHVRMHNELAKCRIEVFLASGHSINVGDDCIGRDSYLPTVLRR